MEKILGIGSRISHPQFGKGVVINLTSRAYHVTFIEEGTQVISFEDSFEVIQAEGLEPNSVSLYDVEDILEGILKKWNGLGEVVPLGDKWRKGTLVLNPADENLTPKEIPIKTFFHKIVMLRDRLRVMEQKINSSKNLSDEEKVDLQQYITRCYGSLTTFNVLFKIKAQQFRGESKG